MDALSSGRLWLGVILGVAGYYAWLKYQERKTA